MIHTQEDILGSVQEPLVLPHLQAPCCDFLFLYTLLKCIYSAGIKSSLLSKPDVSPIILSRIALVHTVIISLV